MDRRKEINVNKYEALTDSELRQAVEEYGARVCPKVRLADALDIDGSGLSNREFSYALKAHFDFSVVNKDGKVAFAVEFDGPYHEVNRNAQRRDRLKNAICERLNMPLLRFNDQHLSPIGFESPRPGKKSFLAGNFSSVIAWVAKCWFLERAFQAAQASGEVPPTEPFIAQSFFGNDPTIHARAYLQEMRMQDRLVKPFHEVEQYQLGDAWTALAVLHLNSEEAIAGFARCLSINFSAMSAWELCRELAILEAANKLQKYFDGQFTPYTVPEVEQWKESLYQSS